MPLYVPASFNEQDRARIRSVIDADSFATLVSASEAGPQVTHAPLMWDEGRSVLTGHLARANPHASLLTGGASILAIFHGAHGYVSPTWYVDENPRIPNVPTWNFAVVHMTGLVSVIDDSERKWEIVRSLAAHYEGGGPNAWLDGGIESHRAKLGAIVGFEIAVSTINAKFKLSQNRSAADQAAVIAKLDASTNPDDLKMAAWMREALGSS